MSAAITIIEAHDPPVLCKRYSKRGGKIEKRPVANVSRGRCRTVAVPTAADMARVLGKVTESENLCIVPGQWRGAEGGPFELVTEGELARLLGSKVGEVAGGVHEHEGRRIGARLKRGIAPSEWLLIDADNPPGIPDEWARLTLAERLVMLEPLVPGISKCERIELRASSARVTNGTGTPGPATHAWLRVNRPGLIEALRARVGVEMVLQGLAFQSPRYSRTEPGKVIGHEWRTVVDLSVWVPGRIVFNARPQLGEGMAAYAVADAGIEIVNAGAGALDIAGVELPAAPVLHQYERATGVRLSVSAEGGAPRVISTGQLTWETEITRRGVTKSLREWVAGMEPMSKLRCEAPFRASESEAAVIRLCEDGMPIVHDVGNGTTYRLAEQPQGPGFAADSQKFAGPSQGADRPQSKHSCGSSQDSQDSQGSPPDDDSQGFDRAAAIKRARALLSPSVKSKAPPYPIDALGPLAEACKAIAEGGQVEPAMAGQCLLGAASLLTQGLLNVETLAGPRPLSIYALTLGYSGDGKSVAQGIALAPVHAWQREQGKAYAEALKDYENARAKRKKGDDVPEPPRNPYRLVGDATVEGLRRDLESGLCSQGVFTDEAATILGGYGMSAEHRGKTAGVFSKLWDAGHLSVSRGTAPRVERYGCRVALHWLIQPMAAAEAIGDPMLAALGFWPRFVAAWPPELEPRKARGFEPATDAAVGAYWKRCAALLEQPLPDDAGRALVLPLADDARALMGKAFERFELEARRGSLRVVKPFALRATEQACRIAGVLAAFGGAQSIDAATARNALALTVYSLDTWRALIDDGAADPGTAHALRLYEWLTERPGWHERLAAIVKDGPACVRSKDKRDAALGLLGAVGLVEVRAGEAYALIPPQGDA